MTDERSIVQAVEEVGLVATLKELGRQGFAAATGLVGLSRSEMLMIPGRVVQAAFNGRFLSQLGSEYETLVEGGQIKPDYERTEQGESLVQQLLTALETPPVDEARFRNLKTLFLAFAAESISTREDPLPQLLMPIAADLSIGEVIVLSTAYRLGNDPKVVEAVHTNAGVWNREVAKGSGLLEGLVAFHETGLMEKKLIGGRTHSDRSGMDKARRFRLTDLGLRLCEFLEAGEALDRESGSERAKLL